MRIEYIQYIMLVISSIALIYLVRRVHKQNKEIKKYKKWLSGRLTDFEILELIVNLHSQVDYDKLRPDEKVNWFNIVKEWIQKK